MGEGFAELFFLIPVLHYYVKQIRILNKLNLFIIQYKSLL